MLQTCFVDTVIKSITSLLLLLHPTDEFNAVFLTSAGAQTLLPVKLPMVHISDQNRRTLLTQALEQISAIRAANDAGSARFKEGLDVALDLFRANHAASKNMAQKIRLMIFMTAGFSKIQSTHAAERRVLVDSMRAAAAELQLHFVGFALGPNADTHTVGKLACAGNGVFRLMKLGSDMNEHFMQTVSNFISAAAPPNGGNTEKVPPHTNHGAEPECVSAFVCMRTQVHFSVQQDVLQTGPVITASAPVFSSNNDLIGAIHALHRLAQRT